MQIDTHGIMAISPPYRLVLRNAINKGIYRKVALFNGWLVVVELPDWRSNQISFFAILRKRRRRRSLYLHLGDDTIKYGIPISAPLQEL